MVVINGFNPDVGLDYGQTNCGFLSLGQALMFYYFNDWLGWFYSGYSGFHPLEKITIERKIYKKKQKIK